MLAPAEAPVSQRVRCRQIVEHDLDALAELLTEGFPVHDRDYWQAGLRRLAALPRIEGMPRFGYVLENGGGIIAGVLLTISSRRGSEILSNVSSWYVRPAYRAHSALLVSMATKRRQVTYLNISPAPHTWRTLQATGWKPYNFGRSGVFALFATGGGRVSRTIPADLPEQKLLEDHRAWGCVSLVCELEGARVPFVFKRRRLARPPLAMLELIYCRDGADFERCAGTLARHFLPRGYGGFIIDGKIAAVPSHYVTGKEPRFYKGPHPPALNDLAYTEKVILG